MAINLKLDLMGNPEPPSIILANRNGNKLGQLDVNVESIDGKDLLETSEFTFTLNKYVDGKLTNLWDKVVDFKLVHCPEWDLWYSIKVELDEATETVKTVFCTQLGQEELSQIRVYNIEINTEADIARDDYKISILYDEDNPDASILHRVMSKAPHYSIAYIDESLKRIQKSFSFDDASICDVFDEIKEEVGCLVVYNSNSDKNGMPKRDISIYDLLQNCKNPNCKHRGEFTNKCPKCGGTDIDYGYGEDTTIFVTSDELATEGIQLVTDTDSVKNCFKLEAGDDLMTATIRNCNPNGSDYIWYFSDAVKEDMSKELVEAIESYDSKYKEYYDTHTSNLDASLVSKYNALVEKYDDYYNTKSTCLNSDCKHEGYFKDECPLCHSGNILTGKSLQTINTPITGYSALMNAYYNTVDLALYLESGLMPNVEMSDTKAEEQVKLLTSSSLSPVAVNVEKIDSVSLATANSAVLSMAKVIVKPTYKVEISASTLSDDKIWSGQFIVTNYSDETDTATGDAINVVINNETEDFIKQKIEKALNKENTDDLSISGLFDEDKYDYDAFCAELKKYALNPLKSFYDACDVCLGILAEQGAGDKNGKLDLYENLYEPYYKRSQAIANEIKIKEDEIAVIKGVYDETNEDNKVLITEGLQTNIEDCRNKIQDALNFEEHLGENLWLELCSYRREDKYSNSNYVSDGLNNAELFERALEFVEVAENEIFKSAELQHSISATLNNLLAIKKFKPLVKYFKTGNWIRVQVDDRIFKLRLLEYDFSYSNLEIIPVKFSDVTKIKNSTTDVKDIFSQAASMASSYDSVQRQAKKGNVARNTIDQWLIDGLNSANVEIKNNNSEEVLITKNGLLARSYSDITGGYSPEQLKITHNIMAYTDDNWETVSSALGKHEYKKWKDNQWVTDTDYGLSSKFVTAGYVTGSQIIGGEIISSNYKLKNEAEGVTAEGTYIDLINGNFSFAGGKIVYNPTTNKVDLSNVTIQWDSVNPPSVVEAGLEEAMDKIDALDAAVNPTQIAGGYVASPLIKGGYLDIKNDVNNTGVVIDPNSLVNNEYIFRVYNGDTTAIGLDVEGNAEFSGTIKSSKIISPDIEGGTIKGVDITAGSTLKVGVQKDEDGNDIENSYLTWISEDGVLNTYNANIQGTLTSPTIIGGTINGSSLNVGKILDEEGEHTGDYYTSISSDGYLKSVEGEFENCTITGGALKIGNDETGYSAWISSEDGILHANGAVIDGDSTFSGTITASNIIGKSTLQVGEQYDEEDNVVGYNTTIDSSGKLTCINADISGMITATSGNFANCTIDDSCTIKGALDGVDGTFSGTVSSGTIEGGSLLIGDKNTDTYAEIDTDGKLSCANADITGVITATTGYIGYQDNNNKGWEIGTNKISGGGVSLYTGSLYIDNGRQVRISVGSSANLNDNPFKVFDDGYIVSSNGIIGSCEFQSVRYPVVGEDLENIYNHDVSNSLNGVQPIWTLNYKVRFSPNDTYSYKTFTKNAQYSLNAENEYSFDWHWAWTNSPSTPPTSWKMGYSFSRMDTSVIKDSPYLWLRCYVMKRVSGGESQDVETVDFYIGDFSGYLTVFNFGDNSLRIGENIITGKTSSIKFEDTLGRLSGTWYYGDAEIATTSWRDAKTNIEEIDNRYSKLFDELRPVRFVYNNGQSNRYHTGFILDELKVAMDVANVDTSELAAYCISDETTGEGGIRYSEFIALCVNEIQKLKKRVAELENK